MIRKELRFYGAVSGALFQARTQKSLCRMGQFSRHVRPPVSGKVRTRTEYVIRSDGSRLRVLVVTPRSITGTLPGVLWLHGGGYAIGTPELDGGYAVKLIAASPCVVVMPDYTLSVEKPYPAAVEDCYLALCWMLKEAERLGVRRNQLFVAGDSAGGGLCCAVTLLSRDRGAVNVAFQMPLYPMLNDQMDTPSMQGNNAPVWNESKNRLAWQQYLGELYGTEQVPKYAAPAREIDYAGLPPAYSFIGTIEPFYDETKRYFAALSAAGVPCTLEEYPGCFHAFDQLYGFCDIAKQATKAWQAAYRLAAE
ncbi:MAG: alpha/beta hydrolase, partial [Eubacteriales bacterium]|nr:alpha/beta hydrolase [Eubacteriales bacterium]